MEALGKELEEKIRHWERLENLAEVLSMEAKHRLSEEEFRTTRFYDCDVTPAKALSNLKEYVSDQLNKLYAKKARRDRGI